MSRELLSSPAPSPPATSPDEKFAWWKNRRWLRPKPFIQHFLFDDCFIDPERGRRARLVAWFGFLGFLFGGAYAIFYYLIGHRWGVAIVSVSSLGFLAAPFLMRGFRSVSFGGNFLAAVMTLGFTGLCYVEGGLRGHAVAWLASVPLCALLLVGKRAAGVWVIISFAAAASVVAAALAEIPVPMGYNPVWHPLVNSAGYLGLIGFLFALGLIFEIGREQAFGRMTKALREVAESNEKLSTLNKEKSEFLGMAAHDLRNPLTIIISYAELLREGARLNDLPRFGNAIYNAGTRMRDLIVDLLDTHATEEGTHSSSIERCSVEELIARSVAQHELNAARKETEITTSVAPHLYASIDPGNTLQVLDNLISNALKYAPPKTCVRIEAVREEDQVLISVKDQGPGISVADQEKLFGKFTRLSAQPTGGESSTGLGLSIVKRLVEGMNGSIACQSTLGEGATFEVRVPLWTEQQAGAASTELRLPAA